jgi:hypothetical protein
MSAQPYRNDLMRWGYFANNQVTNITHLVLFWYTLLRTNREISPIKLNRVPSIELPFLSYISTQLGCDCTF